MKNFLLVASTIVLFSTAVKAETFKCTFTEPFVSFSYSSSTETLTQFNYGKKQAELKKVSMQIDAEGLILLKKADGSKIATIKLTHAGSDGMSDRIFPFESKYLPEGKNFADSITGGCSSTLLAVKEGEEG